MVQTLRSSRPFFKGLSFLVHLTTRSSTLNPFPLLRKNWRLNYWVSMKTVHKSFHLRLFAIFSSIDMKQLYRALARSMLLTLSNIMRHSQVYSRRYCGLVLAYLHFKRPIYSCVQSTLACVASVSNRETEAWKLLLRWRLHLSPKVSLWMEVRLGITPPKGAFHLPDHSRRNENFIFHQNYAVRSVKS